MVDRYDRQRRIPGWSQEQLAQAAVAVVGADLLGQFIAAGLAGLGVGRIFIVDDRSRSPDELGLLKLHAKSGQPRAEALAQLLRKINPEISVCGQSLRLLYEECFRLLPTPTLLIEATADPVSKWACLRYSQKWCVPVLFAAASPTEGRLLVHRFGQEISYTERDYCLLDLQDQPQNPVTAMVMAGLALEETRKILMPLDEYDQPIQAMLSYNRQSASRFDAQADYAVTGESYGGDCVLVGAGALGTWLGIGLVLSGVRRLKIIDHDLHIERHNLNRQILFYEAVRCAKAPELARKLRQLNPAVECEALKGRASEDYFEEHKPDLILSAVDNFTARAILSRAAVRHRLPLIDGGTSPRGGQMAVYQPGMTACLNCQGDIERWAELERQEGLDGESCAQAPEPSVIISNVIIAGLMGAEAGAVLNPASCGPSVTGVIEYSAVLPIRLGLHSLKEACTCHKTVGRKELSDESIGAR